MYKDVSSPSRPTRAAITPRPPARGREDDQTSTAPAETRTTARADPATTATRSPCRRRGDNRTADDLRSPAGHTRTHEKPAHDRGQGKHTAPPRAARKTHLKRRAAPARRGSRPKPLPRQALPNSGRRPTRRASSRTPCQKRENAPEATRSAAGIQGHPQQRKPRTGQPERRRTSTATPAATTPKSRTAAEAAPDAPERARRHGSTRGKVRPPATAEAARNAARAAQRQHPKNLPRQKPPSRSEQRRTPAEPRPRPKAEPAQPTTAAAATTPADLPPRSERRTTAGAAQQPQKPPKRGGSIRPRPRRGAPAERRHDLPKPLPRSGAVTPAATISAQDAQEAAPAARAIPDHNRGRTRRRTHAESRTEDGSRRPNHLPQPRHAEKGAQNE